MKFFPLIKLTIDYMKTPGLPLRYKLRGLSSYLFPRKQATPIYALDKSSTSQS